MRACRLRCCEGARRRRLGGDGAGRERGCARPAGAGLARWLRHRPRHGRERCSSGPESPTRTQQSWPPPATTRTSSSDKWCSGDTERAPSSSAFSTLRARSFMLSAGLEHRVSDADGDLRSPGNRAGERARRRRPPDVHHRRGRRQGGGERHAFAHRDGPRDHNDRGAHRPVRPSRGGVRTRRHARRRDGDQRPRARWDRASS